MTPVPQGTIARTLGIHQSAVSLALRDDPRIRPALRVRVRNLANELSPQPVGPGGAHRTQRHDRDRSQRHRVAIRCRADRRLDGSHPGAGLLSPVGRHGPGRPPVARCHARPDALPVDRAPYDPEKFRFGPRNSTGELNHGWTPINRDVHWEAYPHAGVIRRRMISRQESTVSPSKYRRCQISTFRRIQRRKLWSALPSWCSSTSRRT